MFLSIYGFKMLLVFGPLAMAFSIFPMFRDKAEKWLATTLNIGLVITTMNIIDHFMYALYADMFTNDSDTGFDDVLAAAGINLAMVAFYLLSFWLTSKWVGAADAGRVVSKGIAAAAVATSAMAGAAVMGAGGGKGAGGGSGGRGQNLAKSVQNTTKESQNLSKDM
jgi:hypothetical protein